MEWQPIETAPKDDETLVLLWAAPAPASHDGGMDVGWWYYPKERWNAQHGGSLNFRPTHWMPLPEPPQ